jgi:glutaredoxin
LHLLEAKRCVNSALDALALTLWQNMLSSAFELTLKRYWMTMRKSTNTFAPLFTTVLILLTLSLAVAPQTSAQERPVARFYLFYGETCPHCHEVIDNYLPKVNEKYGDQVEYELVEVWTDTDKYLTLLGLEAKLGVPEDQRGGVPALIIGDQVLIGSRDIPDQLENIIDEYLAQGGVDYPSLDDLPEVVLPTPSPAVEMLVAFDPGHPDFLELNDFIVAMGQEYGSGIQVYPLNLTEEDNEPILERLNKALKVSSPPSGTPQVLIGRRMLVGMEQITQELAGLIDEYLAQGGASLPSWEELEAEAEVEVTPAPTPAPQPIHIAYFEEAGCQNCARTAYDLRVVQQQYPQVVIESFSMEDSESKLLNEWLSDKYGVPEENRLSTPMVFVGEDVLIGTDAILSNLLAAVSKYDPAGSPPTWDDFDPARAEENLVERFQTWGLLAILGAGLIDGLNPCAFATLVFLISYLSFTGRRGHDILLVGAAFSLGVFLTYLLVGVGLFKAIQSLDFFPSLGRWVYLLTALLCIILAIFTIRDFFRARQGQVSEMTLKLPNSLRRRINKVIRENVQVQAFVAMALVTGFIVSFIELACTGQVYYPTIVYMTSVPEFASRAFLFLVLYCLMFIIPLIVVFLLSYYGTSSEQLGLFVAHHIATVKALTALVFVGLALWMTWTLAPLFGATSPWNWILLGGVMVIIAGGAATSQVLEKPDRYYQDRRSGRTSSRRRHKGTQR